MKSTKTLLLLLMMVVMSMGMKAQEVVVTGTGDYTGGTIVVNEEKSSGQTVVITATPANDYYIAKKDIEVIPVRDPSRAAASSPSN